MIAVTNVYTYRRGKWYLSNIYNIVSGGFIVGTSTHVYDNFEDTKGVIINRNSQNRQYNSQKSKKRQTDKLSSTNNTQKSKDRAIWTHTKTGIKSCSPPGWEGP